MQLQLLMKVYLIAGQTNDRIARIPPVNFDTLQTELLNEIDAILDKTRAQRQIAHNLREQCRTAKRIHDRDDQTHFAHVILTQLAEVVERLRQYKGDAGGFSDDNVATVNN